LLKIPSEVIRKYLAMIKTHVQIYQIVTW